MSLISKQDKELAIEALDFYASELILEREFLSSESNLGIHHENSDTRTVLSKKIRSVQTLKNWIALDLAKSNLKG